MPKEKRNKDPGDRSARKAATARDKYKDRDFSVRRGSYRQFKSGKTYQISGRFYEADKNGSIRRIAPPRPAPPPILSRVKAAFRRE